MTVSAKRACTQHRNVVRIDVNRVTPNVFRGKGDGICRDDEIAVPRIDDGRILADLGSNEQTWIILWRMSQQRS